MLLLLLMMMLLLVSKRFSSISSFYISLVTALQFCDSDKTSELLLLRWQTSDYPQQMSRTEKAGDQDLRGIVGVVEAVPGELAVSGGVRTADAEHVIAVADEKALDQQERERALREDQHLLLLPVYHLADVADEEFQLRRHEREEESYSHAVARGDGAAEPPSAIALSPRDPQARCTIC